MYHLLHQDLLSQIADRLQLPSFKNSDGAERGDKILYYPESEELARGLAAVQRVSATLYPPDTRLTERLKKDEQFPGAPKKYGFGAIVFETEWPVVIMSRDRKLMEIYIKRLVPGGFILMDCDQFRKESDLQSAYELLVRLERKIERISVLDRRIMDDDPLVRLSKQISNPLRHSYLIARKPQ